MFIPFANIQKVCSKETLEIDALTTQKNIVFPRKADTIIISAHGEGVHLKLGSYYLCSCDAQDDEQCRKHKSGKRIHTSKLKANNIALLSCNSALFGKELYETECNLLTELMGHTRYILASLIPTEVSSAYIEVIRKLLLKNLEFPEVTYILNQMYNESYGLSPFICCTRVSSCINDQNSFIDESFFSRNLVKIDGNCLVVSDSSNFFLVGDRYLNLSNEKTSDRYFDFLLFNKKIKHLATNITFLENFIFYLRMLDVITAETENFFKIIYKLKNNIYNLSYNSNNTSRFLILSNEQYKILNNMYESIYLSYRKVRKLLISTGYFHSNFENYIKSTFNLVSKYSCTNEKCGRCKCQLYISEYYSDLLEMKYYCYFCPVCGIYSLQKTKKLISHNYRKISDTVLFNIQLADNSGAEVIWQLKNKATGKNWSQITGDGHGVTRINIDGMEKDIHSYKAIIDGEGVEYIHGKFIN
ncbi:hypothetical protein [Streptococcus dysgalactiae]|uniref:hypothetical protein n=1 Tax=Streptococcus dysgalactiae TaxID=1334 RepID=UPI003F76E573